MEDRVKEIMGAVFEVDPTTINETSSQDTIENWDSIRHMSLVVALEEEFGVQLTDDQIADMQSYKLVLLTLQEAQA
ncbi:MAG: acyl carrier protein [Bacteroidetes bacterium]|nr:MAG: acyl carrier protein [Bacteroidota bacterium]